ERIRMNSQWRFALGHARDAEKDFDHGTAYFSYFAKAGYGDGAAAGDFDDRAWRILDLPHDWAVELPFDPRGGHSHGYRAIGRDFPENSVGWYRKTFPIPESDLGRRIAVEFDGVHRNASFWLNGFFLGTEHSGYSGFRFDITDYLNYGGDNVIAVRVDATMEEGWFYEGAGIYRHVWLTKTHPLHVARHGTFVTTEIQEEFADVSVLTTVLNASAEKAGFRIEHTILGPSGEEAAACEVFPLLLNPGEKGEFPAGLIVKNPQLWSMESPRLYTLVTTLRCGDAVTDRYETTFGIRSVHFDPNEGFFLNGRPVRLKGTNNHQDHAGVGTAIPDALQAFRIARLKEMGSNAYRCSHNPPTPELLDACDRLGMLVLNENRLMGSSPEQLRQLERMILRDRNHPSVIAWSLGNEEWAIEGNIQGARIAATMQAFAQRLDPTRRITYASSGGWGHGISMVIDVMGFNYLVHGDIDAHHAAFPEQPGWGTEETTGSGTRGIYEDDRENGRMMQMDRSPGGASIERGIRYYDARQFLAGLFLWTGFDYRGEPNPLVWPAVSSQFGVLDLCGFPKDNSYYLQSAWKEEPVLHIFPHWNFRGEEGRPIEVWAYSNCDEVELFLNGKTLGRKPMPRLSHLEWKVPYQPGKLLAHGYRNQRRVVTQQVETTGAPAAVRLIPDRARLDADGMDVSVITVRIEDGKGRTVPTADNAILFALRGPGRILGVGNGDPAGHEPDRYFETIRTVKIQNLRERALSGPDPRIQTGPDPDDSHWKPAFSFRNAHWEEDIDSLVVVRGTFELPEFSEGMEVNLFTKSIVDRQSIFVNGRLIAADVRRDAPDQAYRLDPAMIHPGRNVYAVIGRRIVRNRQWDEPNRDPGLVQVIFPAEGWKRRVFNGLAQILVQSDRLPGEIVLTAESPGLKSAAVSIRTQAETSGFAKPGR
ncbi:MAG TPA: glycoside hydrolase family 2 protein, partial [bacterium]|nr:glycoside hydrolase family 2 protein [bacterium]